MKSLETEDKEKKEEAAKKILEELQKKEKELEILCYNRQKRA